jgi:hypothetical protein
MNANQILTHNQTIETRMGLPPPSKIHWCHVLQLEFLI